MHPGLDGNEANQQSDLDGIGTRSERSFLKNEKTRPNIAKESSEREGS